jgi:tetratricopeptide (TPR) repeat protein
MGLGECDEAFTTAHAVVEEGMQNQEHKSTVIDALLEVADASLCLFHLDTAFEMCDRAERLRQELPSEQEDLLESLRAHILYVKSIAMYFRDDVHQGIEYALESLAIREELGDTEGILSSLFRIGYLHFEVEPLRTLEYYERGVELNKGLDRKRHVIHSLQIKGLYHSNNGNWDEAEQLLLRSISLAREHEMGGLNRTGLFCLANMNLAKGNYQRAESYFQECLSESERIGARLLIAMSSNNLGEIYRARGDLDKALKGYMRGMEINKEVDRLKGYVVGLGNCGLIQHARGDSDEALRLLEEALAIAKRRKESGLLMKYIEPGILSTVLVLVEKGMIKRAQQHVEELRQIVERSDDKTHYQVYRTAAALVLKSSTLPRNRVLAKEYLTEVADGSLLDYEIGTLAILNLTELLVDELQITGDANVLESFKVRLSRLLDTATEQESTLLLVETLLLQSKVALLQLEPDEANRLLNEARSLAEQKGLQRALKRIVSEQETLLNELSIWEKLGEDKPPMAQRTEKVRIHEQICGMIQQGLWRKMLF